MSVYTFRARQHKRFCSEFLNEIVRIPDSPGERWFNQDLGQVGRAELELEQAKLRLRLTMEDKPHWWFLQRLAVIEKELSV